MVQRADGRARVLDRRLSDLDGRCLNAIPRTMIESRGGESIKGTVIADAELIELGRRVVEALGVRGPCTVQVFRDSEIGLGITDVNTRFGGAFPAPMYAALPGRTYPELIVADGARRADRAARRRVPRRASRSRATSGSSSSTSELRPTGRDIVSPPGPPPPRGLPAQIRSATGRGCPMVCRSASWARGHERAVRLIEANREHLARFMPWAAGQTLADTRAFLDSKRAQLAPTTASNARSSGTAGSLG